MAYTDYTYDPTASASANKITDETQTIDLTTTIAVYPQQGAFFGDSAYGFAVYTKADGDAEYTHIKEGTDFIFSPLFTYASAMASRKRVFSFILLKPSQAGKTSVKLEYQALGGYEDTLVYSQINNSSFDQTSWHDWISYVTGSAGDYNPVTRDPDLVDKSWMEVISTVLTQVSDNLKNNLTNGATLSQDITRLEKRVGGSYTKDETETMRTAPDKIISATSGTNYTMHIMDSEYCYHEGVIVFIASTGGVQKLTIQALLSASSSKVSQTQAINASLALMTVATQKVGDDIHVAVTAGSDGTIYYKTITDVKTLES